MYAIKVDSKFLNVKYFIGPEVFDVAVTAKPKTWKTRDEAERHLAAARVFIAARVAIYSKNVSAGRKELDSKNHRIAKIQEELNQLYEMPYKDVHAKVARLNRELAKLNVEIESRKEILPGSTKTMNRLEKLAAAQMSVVRVVQTVDAEVV